MTEFPTLDLPDDPKLTHNIVHFTRALRAARVRFPSLPERDA